MYAMILTVMINHSFSTVTLQFPTYDACMGSKRSVVQAVERQGSEVMDAQCVKL